MEYAEELGVEWLIIADAAQISGKKLYILGGGWDRLTLNKIPVQHRMAVAVSFRVPWGETNRKHHFEIEMTDGDGASLGKLDGQFEVGRPPGLPQGSPQRGQIALGMTVELKRLGTYMISAVVDDQEARTFPFYVTPGPALTAELQKDQRTDDEQ